MEYLGIAKNVAGEVIGWIKNSIRGYIRFIWRTPNHLGRWGAIFLAAPILFIGLRYLPGLSSSGARDLAELAIIALAFFGLAATLFGGRGGSS